MEPADAHRFSPGPFLVTLSAALATCGLLVLAVTLGWLGSDVGRGADFCEAA